MPTISTLVFITIFPFVIGYTISEAKNINFWKLLPAVFVLYLFFGEAKQASMLISGVAFSIGYALPHVSIFAGIANSVSIFIDKVRYKSEFDELKRKQKEAEDAKAQYERAHEETKNEQRRYEEKRRQRSQREYRSQQKKQSSGSSSGGRGRSSGSSSDDRRRSSGSSDNAYQNNNNSQSSATGKAKERRQKYLKIMGLDPNGSFSKSALKKQYRKQRFKAHPDQGGSKEAFVALTKAYEELLKMP